MWKFFTAGLRGRPPKGSRHNRGAAVDVTLVHLADGSELLMPTPYDDFTERAHRDFMQLPDEAIQNRQSLEDVMTRHGFIGLPTEWWHFDFGDWRK
jgi:D-alanyl-D-alanine dipeptidase